MAPLKSAINSKLDHPFAFDTWFALLLQYAWVENLSENYRPFGEIGLATLHMAAQKLKRKNFRGRNQIHFGKNHAITSSPRCHSGF